jgi:WD40 repeat protein
MSRVQGLPAPPPGTRLDGHTDEVDAVAFSSVEESIPGDSTLRWLLASGSKDGTVRLWDATTGQPLPIRVRGAVTDQSLLPLSLPNAPGWITAVAFRPTGGQLAVGTCGGVSPLEHCPEGGKVVLLDLATGDVRLLDDLTQPLKGVDSLAFSEDGTRLAVAGCVDVRSNQARAETRVCASGAVRLWNLATGGQPRQLTRDDEVATANAVDFSPSGLTLAAVGCAGPRTQGRCPQGWIQLWDLTNQSEKTTTLSGGGAEVTSVAFDPMGTHLATGSKTGTIQLFDVATGEPLRSLSPPGFQSWITSVAFAPNGRVLASSNRDPAVRTNAVVLWQIAPSTPPSPLASFPPLHTGWVDAVAFRPDGQVLASASQDQSVILWNPDPTAWPAIACVRAHRSLTPDEWNQHIPLPAVPGLLANVPGMRDLLGHIGLLGQNSPEPCP